MFGMTGMNEKAPKVLQKMPNNKLIWPQNCCHHFKFLAKKRQTVNKSNEKSSQGSHKWREIAPSGHTAAPIVAFFDHTVIFMTGTQIRYHEESRPVGKSYNSLLH